MVRFNYPSSHLDKDNIDISAGDTNLYAYVESDLVNSVDPSGLMKIKIPKKILEKIRSGYKKL